MTDALTRGGTWATYGILAIDSLATGIFVPISLIFLSINSGESVLKVGLLLTLGGAVSLPLPILIGVLVDRFGPRHVILASQLVQAAGFATYLVAGSAALILVVAIVASAGQRAFWSSVFALVGDLSDRDTAARSREHWFGMIGSFRSAGYGLGVVISGVTLLENSTRIDQGVVLGCSALLALAGALLHWGIPHYSARRQSSPAANTARGYRTLLRDRPYLSLIGINTIYALCNVTLSVGLPLFVRSELPAAVWVVGPLLAFNTATQALLQRLVVRWIRPLRRRASLSLAGVLWAAWALLTIAPIWQSPAFGIATLVLAIACYSAAQLLHSPVSNSLSTAAAAPQVRGRYLAAFQYSFALASVAAPALFVALFSLAPPIPWITVGAAAILTVPTILALSSRMPELMHRSA